MIYLYDFYESQVKNIPYKIGNLIFTKDTGNIYYDSEEGRINLKDNIKFISTESERMSMLAPLPNRIYCVLDSGKMYMYTTDWIKIGSNSFEIISNEMLSTDGWVENTYTVSNELIKYFHTVKMHPDLSTEDIFTNAGLSITNVKNGYFTITATSVPTSPIFVTFYLQ